MLTSNGTAEIKNVVTDAATGQTYLDTAYAKHSELSSLGFPHALRSVASRRVGASLVKSRLWK